MDLKRILVAVDTTSGRHAAFDRALALARTSGGELVVVHAVPTKQLFSDGAAERLERTRELRGRAEEAGVRLQTIEQHGDPAGVIALHADSRDVDLIVMGSEPRRGGSRRRSSPVAERVLRRTSRPTLLVTDRHTVSEGGFQRVLVAVDLFEDSRDLVTRSVAMTAPDASPVTVLHTVTGLEAESDVQSVGRWIVPEYRTYMLDVAKRDLDGLLSSVPGTANVQARVATGPAAQAILDESVGVEADLIVVGKSRGFRPLGSTAQRVMRQSATALLVVPSPHGRRATALEHRRAA